ncbi:MAG: AAA family ATPase [Nitrososphaeria archaeon]
MTAEVIIENVGGLSGTHIYKFSERAVNLVKSPNASGKTSLIKALSACLSAPIRRELILDIAKNMGLVKQLDEAIEPFIHLGKESARVVVKFDNYEWSYSLFRNGEQKCSGKGDERFLVTSVLTRDSEIFKELISGKTDFKWLVDNISLANRYEIAISAFEKEKVRINDMLYSVNVKIKELADSKTKLEKLKKTLESYKTRETELNRHLSELLSLHPEFETLKKRREKLIEEINEIENNKKIYQDRYELSKKKIKDLTNKYQEALFKKEQLDRKCEELAKEINRKEKYLENLDNELKYKEEKLKVISERIENLRVSQGKYLAQIELYERALNLTTEEERVLCFLCEQGYLSKAAILKKKLQEEGELNKIKNEIAHLISERDSFYLKHNEREELKRRLEKDKEELGKLLKQKRELEAPLERYKLEAEPIKKEQQLIESKLIELENSLNSRKKELADLDERLQVAGEKEQNIIKELAEIRGRITEVEEQLRNLHEELERGSYIKIMNFELKPEEAISILNNWLNIIEAVIKETEVKLRKERREAAELFNEEIRRVLKELNFNYIDVWIDLSNYRLNIIKNGNEITPRILSETEKYTLTFVIHLALKLAYLKHIPFFLIDEVMLSFDDAKKNAILNYLVQIAENNNWIIVVTELSTEPELSITTFKRF